MIQKHHYQIYVLAFVELCAMNVWFAASSVAPEISSFLDLTESKSAWLTMSVQLGFVVGGVLSATIGLADRISGPRLFVVGSLSSAIATFLIPLSVFYHQLEWVIILRILTGGALAFVYPIGIKILSSWTTQHKGFGVGLIVGALTIGSALPHLIKIDSGNLSWHWVVYISAAIGLTGSFTALLFLRNGPYGTPSSPFRWGAILDIVGNKNLNLINMGYFGHMWELYAMWTWIPLFLANSTQISGDPKYFAYLIAFIVIASGGFSSILAGILADKIGRKPVVIGSLIVSGLCCLLIGSFYGGNIYLLAIVSIIWGLFIISDSAQFSAAISDYAPPNLLGTALTFQTAMGFLITMISIQLIPVLKQHFGWENAFNILFIGPLLGIISILFLLEKKRVK